MNTCLILFDDHTWQHFLPLTYTRPLAHLRLGITRLVEKWQYYFPNHTVSTLTMPHLQPLFPMLQHAQDNIWVNAALLPSPAVVAQITALKPNQALTSGNALVACRTAHLPETIAHNIGNTISLPPECTDFPLNQSATLLRRRWDLFRLNDQAIHRDFEYLTRNRTSQPISPTNRTTAPENIFIEEGATVEHSILNAATGVIYIAEHAEVMEGCMLRGALAVGAHTVVKMGAKIYGATTLGDYSKVGGEISNSIFQGYSNKAHDGFLGNSLIGQWCNLGADTNNSNLKNNYGEVSVWSYPAADYEPTGLQFCGLTMGDHSKCSINTMFNTGTVVGVSANIFGNGFPPKLVPSFSWGGSHELSTFNFEKAMQMIARVYERRQQLLLPTEIAMLRQVETLAALQEKI